LAHIQNDTRAVEGEGVGEAVEDVRYVAVDNSRKRAVTDSRKNAFKTLSIVLLPNDKSFLYVPGHPLPSFILDEGHEESVAEVKRERSVEDNTESNRIFADPAGDIGMEQGKFKKQKVVSYTPRTYTVSHSY
jgi:hypothetical protein